jgi:hypothetical protein
MKITSTAFLSIFFFILISNCFAQSSYSDYGYDDRNNLFYDSFNSSGKGWEEDNTSTKNFYLLDGTYILNNKKASGTATSLITVDLDTSKDFEIEAKIKVLNSLKKTQLISLVWGSSIDKNYFGFTSEGSYRISKYVDGSYSAYKDWTELSSVSEYSYNKLTIRKVASRMYFFVNGTLVYNMSFKKFFGNRIGFQSPSKTKIKADYLRVSYLKKNKKSYDMYSYRDKTIAFYEGFSDNNREWKDGYESKKHKGSIKNGYYTFKSLKSSGASGTYQNINIDTDRDFEIEAKIKYSSGKDNSGLMLIWGRDNNSNNNNFEFTANKKYWIGQYKDDNYKADVSWTEFSSLNKYAYNRLTIRKIGNKYYYFINKKFVYSKYFSKFFGTKIGFLTPSNTEIIIDYLSVSYLDKNK